MSILLVAPSFLHLPFPFCLKSSFHQFQRVDLVVYIYQRNISCKDGHNKGQNGKDLTEAEEIKRWQEYTEELNTKALNDPDNHNGVITHLDPDILECKVKWA